MAGRRRPSHGVPFARTCKHSLFQDTTAQVGRLNRNRLQYGAVYGDGSASVDPLHALVVDHSDEVWSVGGLDYLPSEGFGSDVVALDVELCRRWRSRWRSCGSMTAHVNTWPRWSTGGPLPRLHVVRRALTNRTTTAGSGRCAESEAAAIVTKVTVGQYVKLQVWTMLCHSFDPRLADGRRFHAVLGTPPSPGTFISLRVPAGRGFSVEDCVASGSLTPVPRNSCPA